MNICCLHLKVFFTIIVFFTGPVVQVRFPRLCDKRGRASWPAPVPAGLLGRAEALLPVPVGHHEGQQAEGQVSRVQGPLQAARMRQPAQVHQLDPGEILHKVFHHYDEMGPGNS